MGYPLAPGYTPSVATAVTRSTPSWYLNPIYATHLMRATMSQFRLLIAPIAQMSVPPYTMQLTMTLGLRASHQNLVSQNLMSRIPMSQSVTTTERLHMGETRLCSQI